MRDEGFGFPRGTGRSFLRHVDATVPAMPCHAMLCSHADFWPLFPCLHVSGPNSRNLRWGEANAFEEITLHYPKMASSAPSLKWFSQVLPAEWCTHHGVKY